jgi:hypothetical protein
MRLSRIILAENPDGSMPAHMEGHEGKLLVETQIQSLRMSGFIDGAPDVPAAGHPLCRFVLCSSHSGRALTHLAVTRIGTQDTSSHRLRRPKEVSAMTWPTIQKIPDDHSMLPNA